MISGKEFAKRCKWVYDPRYPEMPHFNFEQATSNDWVFINGDYLYDFISKIPLFTTKKFTIFVHNSDQSFDHMKLAKSLRIANKIYAINTTVSHPQLTTIPLGFVDNQLPFLSTFQPSNETRDFEIYQNFTPNTNVQKRNECASIYSNNPKLVVQPWKPVPEYYADLCHSNFVLCPEGTGIDTHRVYESILCGAIPVVVRNSLSHLYETLPVCILEQWGQPFYVPERKEFSLSVDKYL